MRKYLAGILVKTAEAAILSGEDYALSAGFFRTTGD
jgi:hypothetical protein